MTRPLYSFAIPCRCIDNEGGHIMRQRHLGVRVKYLSDSHVKISFAGRLLSKSATPGERIHGYVNERGIRILDALDSVGGQAGASPSEIAVAWLVNKPNIVAPS
jgi:hypothetical protein